MYIGNIFAMNAFLIQIFLPCYFGQEITSESDFLSTRMYSSNWLDLIGTEDNGDYGKIMIIFMERLKRNNQVLIGKMFPLSLNTFTAVSSVISKLLLKF